MIRLLVADDHPVARAGVIGLVAGTDIEVSCEVGTCTEAVRQALRTEPNVVLLDVRMPESDGFHALQQIKKQKRGLPVLMFSVSDSWLEITRAHQLGAAGFIPKGADREPFLMAIRKAASGKPAWTRGQVQRMCAGMAGDGLITDNTANLTPRECEVLGKMVCGLGNDDIADELGIDVETIKQHVQHISRRWTSKIAPRLRSGRYGTGWNWVLIRLGQAYPVPGHQRPPSGIEFTALRRGTS